ncbi:MAG: UpxY family transcription antiterminator [Bacteroidota bacterium]
MSKKNWLAVYTKPRWEKKIDQVLQERGIESYCPLNKVLRKWSDRMKMVEEPLFKSYVFVHINAAEEQEVRLTNGVLNFVYWLGRPAVIRASDIDRIKRFLREYENVEALAMNLPPNSRVIIKSGLLMDKEARVISANKKRVEIEIESMGYKLVAFVDKANVTPVSRLTAAPRKTSGKN